MAAIATIEQHRRDYRGVLRTPVRRRTFPTALEAKAFVEWFFRTEDTADRFGVVETFTNGRTGRQVQFSSFTPTDGPADETDWSEPFHTSLCPVDDGFFYCECRSAEEMEATVDCDNENHGAFISAGVLCTCAVTN